jgi:hypothetical protein
MFPLRSVDTLDVSSGEAPQERIDGGQTTLLTEIVRL